MLWLEGRLRWAHRALDLLDSKRYALLIEDRRLAEVLRHTAARWDAAGREARAWAVRARASSGAWAVWLASSSLEADAAITVTTVRKAGVAHPGDVDLRLPALPAAARVATGPVIQEAAAAARQALRAAAAHAAAEAAYRIVHTELKETERHQRAIEHLRIPALESELAELMLRLDELERQERVVGHWAAARIRRRSQL